MPSPAPPGLSGSTNLFPPMEGVVSAPLGQSAKALGGAGAVGMALAVYFTQPEGVAWDPVEIPILGAGIAAAISYVIGWVDLLKARLQMPRLVEEAAPFTRNDPEE